MARRERFHTKQEIIRCATEEFISRGYTQASTTKLAEALDISLGNLTYHFPSKEHLLAELTVHLCEYHQITLENEVDEGRSSLLAYLMELTSMMAICEENEVAKDLYTSIYRHNIPLKILRAADTAKIKVIFAEFCPDWSEEDFALTENVISGIEYASLIKENVEDIPLDHRIAKTLTVVMKAYNVPEELRKIKINKVLSMDYRKIGRRFIDGFAEYVEKANEEALKAAAQS